jgi:hypothetical protein
MRIVCYTFFGLALLLGSLTGLSGCGGPETGMPEEVKNMPPPEIPGTAEMEKKLQEKGIKP